VSAIVAAIQAIMAPFSPLCCVPEERADGRSESVEDRRVDDEEGGRDDPTVETGTNAVGGRGKRTNKRKRGGRKTRNHTSDSDAESENSNTKWGTKKRKAKKAMSDDELCLHFLDSLSKQTIQGCGNKGCNCMKIMENERIRLAVARYLAWFENKEKLEQDTILLEWYKY
jgi:hypothetical protein